MANTTSARKATRKIARRTAVNKSRRTGMRNTVRAVEQAVARGDREGALTALKAAEPDLTLACQLAEWAHAAAPDDTTISKLRAELYTRRAAGEPSLMARAIFTAASR